VALAGKSNVGKSTLLNALLSLSPSKRGAAAVGDKPGVRREGGREGGRERGRERGTCLVLLWKEGDCPLSTEKQQWLIG